MKSKLSWQLFLLPGLILILMSLPMGCEGTQEPGILFDPPSLSFATEEGKSNPSNQTLEIKNAGVGCLGWTVSSDAPWLSLSPDSGTSCGEVDKVTVTVDISGMSAGDYSTTVTITGESFTSGKATADSPQTVPVDLSIS